MPAVIPDLWPADIFSTPRVTPIAVLRTQGDALGARTHNFVHGDVETSTSADGKQFAHTLHIAAPLIRYRKALLRVDQPQLAPYPAMVVETDLTKQPNANYWSRSVADEQELQESLREFFNEPRVKEILRSVINLSNDVAPADGE